MKKLSMDGWILIFFIISFGIGGLSQFINFSSVWYETMTIVIFICIGIIGLSICVGKSKGGLKNV